MIRILIILLLPLTAICQTVKYTPETVIRFSDLASIVKTIRKPGTDSVFNAFVFAPGDTTWYFRYLVNDVSTSISKVTGLQAALDAKAAGTHTHTTADVTNYDIVEMKAYQALGSRIKCQTVGSPLQLANTSSALTDGQIRWVAVYLDKAATLTGLSVYMRTAGSYTGDNNNRVGLYTYSAGTLTLVASSTNNSTLWTAAGNAFLNVNFSSTYSAAQGLYFAAILYNNSAQTTAPAIATGTALNNAAMANIGFTNSAKLYGTSNGTDLPASIAMSSITASTATTWIGLF